MEDATVEIPKCLKEKLDPLGPHFCLVAPRDKNPNVGGRGWQKTEKLMCSKSSKLQAWLAKGGNYGVVGGFGLVILDADIPEIKHLIEDKLPSTFTVESPGSHGWHCYFLCGLEKPIRLRDKEGENVGDIQASGKMCVGPGSIHPNGGIYRVVKDVPLAQVTKQQLVEALKPYVIPEKEVLQVEQAARSEKARANLHLDITQVVPLTGLHRRGNEYFGPHPVHGSKTGRNFCVNTVKNCWHCWRHGSGGGPLLWLAVEEGIINCEDAGPGALRGEVFKRVLEKARERGFIEDIELQKQAREQGEIKETVEKYLGKNTYPILLKTIGYTVKRDNIAKQLDLLHVLSMYAAPINELKEAPTSEGKTYPVMQIIRLFPREDSIVLGGLSPTALAHDYGVPVDAEGEDLRPAIQEIRGEIEKFKDEEVSAVRNEKKRIKREIEKLQRKLYELMKGSKRLIDLENKVIIFVDNPDPRTWARLRPIMSHDLWETTYKFTDRPRKGGPLKQVTAILRGWPVFIAFKAEETPNKGWTRDVWAQILTRGTTVPVEMSPEKYKEAIKLTGVRKGLPQPVVDRKLHMEEFRECRKIVGAIRQRILTLKQKVREQTGRRDLPNIFWIPFHNVVAENFPSKKGGHMREVDRFFSVVQNHAVANVFNRPTLEINNVCYLICTIQDLAKAVELYFSDEARKTIFGKIPTNKIKFFEKVILPLSKQWPDGVGTAAMQEKYKEVFDESISTNTINYHYLQPLENMDLISRDNDPNNKRRKLTVPLREKVFTGEARIRTLFEKGDIFTLKNLEEAFSELKQLIVRDTPGNIVKIKDHDGTVINVETLYDKYFSQKCLITAGFANNYLSEQEEDLKLKKEIRDKPLLETGTISLSLGEKLEIVYSKCRELAVDGLVSKFAVTDALKAILDRNEVFKLLAKLESEGKLVAKGPEWYRVV